VSKPLIGSIEPLVGRICNPLIGRLSLLEEISTLCKGEPVPYWKKNSAIFVKGEALFEGEIMKWFVD